MKRCSLALLFLSFVVVACAADAPSAPAAGQVFLLTPDFPKYVTADLQFRDPKGEKWPSLFYGKPITTNGFIKFDPAQPQGAFVLYCDKRPQKNGDQSRRVLGELFGDPTDTNGVALRINSLGPLQPATDAKNKGAFQTTLTGVLDIQGRKVSVSAPATLRYHAGGRSDEKNESLMIDASWEIKAADLSLKSFAAADVIHVRSTFTAVSAQAVAAATARRR